MLAGGGWRSSAVTPIFPQGLSQQKVFARAQQTVNQNTALNNTEILLCFSSHQSSQSDEIHGPSRPDKRFIFRLPSSTTSAAGPAGWAVTSGNQWTRGPCCWHVLGGR